LLSLITASWKIADFGLTTEGAADEGTSTIGFGGTRGYRAPELIQHGYVTMKSDIWGLGVVIHELACGERPWKVEFEAILKPRDKRKLVPDWCDDRAQTCLSLLTDSLLEMDWAKRPSARDVRGLIAAISSDSTEVYVMSAGKQTRQSFLPRQIRWKLVEWKQAWYNPGQLSINIQSVTCGPHLTVTDIARRGKHTPIFKCKCVVAEPLIEWGLFLDEGEPSNRKSVSRKSWKDLFQFGRKDKRT
jgi:serine/threonine protein kinase